MLTSLTHVIHKQRLNAWSALLRRINAAEDSLQALPDAELRRKSVSLRYRAKSGEPAGKLLPDAYALVREAARRTVKMRHFDVQLLGGMALFHGYVAEMETGEGKTLTATLPLYLRALYGKGAHLATVNDYLAKRDADWMAPIYRLLGLTVGAIQTGMPPNERREIYACDITYGTAKEFGFDFLKDRLQLRLTRAGWWNSSAAVGFSGGSSGSQPMQREPHFALVDEADSVLIDEATTPLIISGIPGEAEQRAVACYQWSASVIDRFLPDAHYEHDHEKRTVELTPAGRQLARGLVRPPELSTTGLVDIYKYIARAIKVKLEFNLDEHYVVRDGEVVIVDEYTGRLGEGRKWSGGIHQAVEAKESAAVTVETGHAARVTVQDYFLRYRHLAGMTGTAITSASEFKKVYRVPVIQIPTNRPKRRSALPERVFVKSEDKWNAIVDEVRSLYEARRPVLIGTRTIDKSEHLSRLLRAAEIPHLVLNASHIAAEAEIVSHAGEPGKVTVATNMAGRGTDIKLGAGVAEAGGMTVIGTEMHDAARIDRQLFGRCGRQGDPGSYRQYVSLEDEILRHAFGPQKAVRIRTRTWQQTGRLFRRAQRRIERLQYRMRRVLLYHEKHRKKMQREMGLDPYVDTPE